MNLALFLSTILVQPQAEPPGGGRQHEQQQCTSSIPAPQVKVLIH